MADPTTPNLLLAVPTRGSDPGTWDVPVNGNTSAFDGYLGGVQTISVSNANITLTAPPGTVSISGGPTQSQNAMLVFTGTLTGNVVVELPLPGIMLVYNLTTGNFTLSFVAQTLGQVIAIEQGNIHRIVNDGTNIRFADLPAVGSYLDLCDSVTPSWITACSVPPYLNCDGSTFNAATYPYLNQKLGGNTLPDLRGVARYTLNQGTARLTGAISGLDGDTRFSLKATQYNTIQIANLPPYSPSGTIVSGPNTGTNNIMSNPGSSGSSPGGGAQASFPILQTIVAPLTITSTFAGAAQGGTSAPFGTVATGTVFGITLIRAA